MNISTNRHFKVLIKISSYGYCNVFKNIQAGNHRPLKWATLHMQLIMEDVAAQTTLGLWDLKQELKHFSTEGSSTNTASRLTIMLKPDAALPWYGSDLFC